MRAEPWDRIKRILADALEQPAAEREAFIARACAGDEALRREVAQLLEQDSAAGSFLHPVSAPAMAAAAMDQAQDELVGRTIGPYRVVRRIASGGMGTVYEAEQAAPRRAVALKVIQRGLATPSVLRRLLYEAELLARLDHPGIARVLEAGTYDLGDGARPYFVMELVDGLPLMEYAQLRSPSLDVRLALLIGIVEAVEHAHQRGVIHRDLKPANILVEQTGAEQPGAAAAPAPRTRVLDFGVARALEADSALATMHTAVGELVGTIRYMSPEQLAGDPRQVDTRSDLYALGVIAYELLAGRMPYDLKSGTVAEATRAILEQEPAALGSVDRRLRGDLETIVHTAMAKEKERRYASAAALASDLRRFRAGEPIAARPPTVWAQLRRFARRNRALVGGAAATVLTLIAGLVIALVQARRIDHEARQTRYEAEKYRAVHDFIVNDFLWKLLAQVSRPARDAAGPSDGDGRAGVVALIDQAEADAARLFAGQPLHEAAVRNQIATMYYNIGLYTQAEASFARALEIGRAHLGGDHRDTLSYANNTALAKMRQGDLAGAEPLYRAAYEGRRSTLGEEHADTLISMNNLAALFQQRQDLPAAEGLLRRAIAIQSRVRGEVHADTLTSMSNLAGVLQSRGNLVEAEEWHRRAAEGLRRTLGPDHVTTLVAESRLASVVSGLGNAAAAEPQARAALDGLERTLGPDHSHTLAAMIVLGEVLTAAARPDEAEPILQRALDGATRSLGPNHRHTLAAARRLEEARAARGR